MNEKEMIETRLSTKRIYDGKILKIDIDEVAIGNGTTGIREIARHPGGACVLALTDDNRVYFVKQYRYAFEQFMLELPAGKRDSGEDPFITAQRELEEETGMHAKTWIPLGSSLASPGCFTERLYMYAAKDLIPGKQHLDPDEFLDVSLIPFDKALDMVMNNEFEDAKTQLTLLKFAAYLNRNPSK